MCTLRNFTENICTVELYFVTIHLARVHIFILFCDKVNTATQKLKLKLHYLRVEQQDINCIEYT